jgi:hypothetical protein
MRIGKAAKKNAVDHAEDRRGGPDSHGEREDRDDREPRAIPKAPQSKSEVLEQRIENSDATLVAVPLFGLFDASEFAVRGIARFFKCQAFADIFLDQHVEMVAQLGIEFTVQLLLEE